MTTPPPAHAGEHTAVTCLACGTLPRIGHLTECPAADPNTTGILTETLPDGTERIWTVVGARYSLTPARRNAITACMPGMRWVRPIDRPSLSFHTGALVNEVVPQLGIANRLAGIGVNEPATVAVPDCGCADRWRCRCDFPDHPFRHAEPDLWPEYGLLGLKVRYSNGWTHVWLLDTGTAAVVVATDFTATPAVEHVTKACWLGWCDRCPGTIRQPSSGGDPTPCRCSCRHNPSAPRRRAGADHQRRIPMKADLTYHHLRRIVRALTPPAGQPPRVHLPVPVHTASGPAVHTTVIAEHLLRLCIAGVGETTVRVNTTSNLAGITRGRFSGAVIHLRLQHPSSTSDGAVTSQIRGDVMLRVVAVSVRGPKYLVGDPTVHDIEEVPAGVGTQFASIAEVQHSVTRELRGLSVYWRVEVVEADGAVVWRGTRDGHHGTGPNWIWKETHDKPHPHVRRGDHGHDRRHAGPARPHLPGRVELHRLQQPDVGAAEDLARRPRRAQRRLHRRRRLGRVVGPLDRGDARGGNGVDQPTPAAR